MARKTGRSRTALAEAAGGDHLPTWQTVEAFVSACDGEPADWLVRWGEARGEVQRERAGELPQTLTAEDGLDRLSADAESGSHEQTQTPAATPMAGVEGGHRRHPKTLIVQMAAIVVIGSLVGVFLTTRLLNKEAPPDNPNATSGRSDFGVILSTPQPVPQQRQVVITADIGSAPPDSLTYWLVLRVPEQTSSSGVHYYPRFRLPSQPQQIQIRLQFPSSSDSTVTRTARIYAVPAPTDKRFEANMKMGIDAQPPDIQPPCLSCISSNEIEIHFLG